MSWGGLVEMFNPGHRHLREEMDRTTGVDLDNNVVRIPQPRAKERRDDAPADAPEDLPDDVPQDE